MVALVGLFTTVHPVCAIAQTAQPTVSARLTWDPNSEPDLAGYRVYYGTKTLTYTNMTDVGSAVNLAIPGLVPGVTYFFAVTAYNQLGLESDYSLEVAYTPLPTANLLALLPNGPGKAKLRFSYTGSVGTGFKLYTNSVLYLSAVTTAASSTVLDLPGIVPGIAYSLQVALMDPISGEQPKSAPVALRIPGLVGSVRRQ